MILVNKIYRVTFYYLPLIHELALNISETHIDEAALQKESLIAKPRKKVLTN